MQYSWSCIYKIFPSKSLWIFDTAIVVLHSLVNEWRRSFTESTEGCLVCHLQLYLKHLHRKINTNPPAETLVNERHTTDAMKAETAAAMSQNTTDQPQITAISSLVSKTLGEKLRPRERDFSNSIIYYSEHFLLHAHFKGTAQSVLKVLAL